MPCGTSLCCLRGPAGAASGLARRLMLAPSTFRTFDDPPLRAGFAALDALPFARAAGFVFFLSFFTAGTPYPAAVAGIGRRVYDAFAHGINSGRRLAGARRD